jgi:phage N-6-adenine-methyltransferase
MTFYKEAPPEGNDGVATSAELWRPIDNAIGGFDLDPAAGCEPTPIADERYTPEDDGLTSPWFGKVWLNPPFSNKDKWYKRLINQYNNGDVTHAVAIAPVDTSTAWFHDWFAKADKIAFLEGRAWYHEKNGNGGAGTFGTMVGVWNDTQELINVLDGMGMVAQFKKDEAQATWGDYNHD